MSSWKAPAGGSGAVQYAWIDSLSPTTLADTIERGAYPVLPPWTAALRGRWESVLEWYGLTSSPAGVPAAHPQDDEGHVVCCVAGFEQLIASYYARVRGRTFIERPTLAMAHREIAADAASLTYFAPPSQLTREVLQQLIHAEERPWGVITGRHPASVLFLATKCLIASRREALRGVVTFDAETGRAFARAPVIEGAPWGLNPDFWTGEWTCLAVRGHGRDGHLRAGATVICGLLDEVEEYEGMRLHGCARAEAQCKRASPGQRVIHFDAVRAVHLLLLSCNLCVPGGDLYGSNVNAVLSALEGYVSTVVGSPGLVSGPPELLEFVGDMLKSPLTMWEIGRMLTRGARHSRDPFGYLVVGDALARDPRVKGPVWPSPPVSSHRIDLTGPRSIIRVVDAAGRQLPAWHLGDACLVRSPAGSTDALVEADCLVASALDLTSAAADASWFVARIESALRVLGGHRAGGTELAEIVAARSRLDDARLGLEAALVQATEGKVLRDDVGGAVAAVLSAAEDGQGALARTILQLGFGIGLPEVLTYGLVLAGQEQSGPPCPDCSLATSQRTWRDLGRIRPPLRETYCPTCGCLEIWPERATRVGVDAPAMAVPGGTLVLGITSHRPQDASLVRDALCVGELRDRRFNRVLASFQRDLEGPHMSHTFLVPPEITANQHALRLAVVDDMRVAFARTRVRAYPR